MQKNFYWLSGPRGRRCLTKIFMAMRLTALLLTVAFLQVQASSSAQSVSLSGTNIPLDKVFNAIEKQTGYVVFSKKELLVGRMTVSVDAENLALRDFMNVVLKGLPLTYDISDKTIFITRKSAENVFIPEAAPVLPPAEGTVYGADGKPLPGVTVTVKGIKRSVSSDDKGHFSIDVPEGGTLVFSYVGYETREVKAQGSGTMSILLEPAVKELDQTVIVGYGSVKRKDLTGSVASVRMDEVKNMPAVTLDNAIAGKASGVQVIKADGSPGGGVRIRIRGGSSLIGSNDPLYIIDGVPVLIENKYVGITDVTNPIENYGGENSRNSTISGSFARGLNNLGGLNIDDIETLDILKDASATAIYGAKAANGVVIITTKKGKLNQKPTLEVNYYTGISNPRKEKLLNREQYLMIKQEAARNRVTEDTRLGATPDANAAAIAANPSILGMPDADTDWLGLVLRNGFTQNGSVSVRGGGTGSRYYTSLSFTNAEGAVIASDFSRIAGKFSLDNEITKRLKVITNLDYGFHKNNLVSGIYSNALVAPPVLKPYNDDGSFVVFDQYNRGSDFGAQNPLALATSINSAKTYTLIGSISLEYDILSDLKFKSTASVNYSAYRQRNYTPSYLEIGSPNSQGGVSSNGGVGSQSAREVVDVFYENTLTWDKQFNTDNRLNLLGGTSWEKYRSEFFSAEGRGYPDDMFLNNLNSASTPVSVKGMDPEGRNSLLSYYARANYSLKDKYLLTATGRMDISSKFATGRKSAFFPSAAVAWRLSEENFLKEKKWIDEIKLRVSAGYVGTHSISDFMYLTLFSPSSYAGTPAIIPSQLGNDKIKWERTLQKDLGLDFAFFHSRLRGTLAYYEKGTDGLLLNVTPAPSYAVSSVILNVANITNKGVELEVRGDVVQRGKFNWNTALNISRNRSMVTHLNGGPFSDPNNRNSLNLGTSIVREGSPLGLLYGRVATGILKTQKEVDEYKAAASFQLLFNRWLNIGDVKYDTIPNSSGNTKQDVIGFSAPDFFGGFTNIFTWKNFSLTTHLTFSYGNELLYQRDVTNRGVNNLLNHNTDILDRWTPENPSSTRPRLLWGTTVFSNNMSVYDASYIKLRSASIGYDLPKTALERLKIKSASFYVSANNLFIISKYPGLDPEVTDNPSSVIGGGRDLSTFPSTREMTVGVRLGL